MADGENYNITLDVESPDVDEDYGRFNYTIDEPGGPGYNNSYDVAFIGYDRDSPVPIVVNESIFWNNSDFYGYGVSPGPCSSMENFTCNGTDVNTTQTSEPGNPYALWQIIFLAILAGTTSIVTILGNLIVVLSFILERTIRQPTNYFIASLACSDLLIGSISMPFYTVYLLAGQSWPLGEVLCDLWLSVDYTVCLTSIYTVFCITIDRFCMVKIPAKYRNWRTEQKVLIMVAATWVIPTAVFFTSIFGWQYFVGERTVPEGKCYVQYMEDALFNCILQVGYFWTTLTVMCVLYTGIYKVALDLQKKSEAKHKKMTSLVSMAGQTMTKIGIGMSQQGQKVDTNKLFPDRNNTLNTNNTTTYDTNTAAVPNQQGTSTTSFSSGKNNGKDEDRSSSPAYPSDTDPSSQSPKRTPKAKKEVKLKKVKHKKKNSTVGDVPKIAGPPPKEPKARKKSRGNIFNIGASKHEAPANSVVNASVANHVTSPPPKQKVDIVPEVEIAQPITNGTTKAAVTTPVYDNPSMVSDESPHPNKTGKRASRDSGSSSSAAMAISAPPELLAGVRYIDQESIKSLQSNDNIKLLVDAGQVVPPAEINEEPESPVWKKRTSFIDDKKDPELEPLTPTEKGPGAHKDNAVSPPATPRDNNSNVNPNKIGDQAQRNASSSNSGAVCVSPPTDSHSERLSTANIQVETANNDKRTVSKIAKPEEIQPLNAKSKEGRGSGKKNKKTGLHVPNLVKSVRRSKRGKNKKEKSQKSRTENRARKALRTITIILGAFVLCWTPWHILSLIIGFCPSLTTPCVVPVLYDISYWLCYLNSPINPLCYAFANQQFKKTFIRIMKFDWHKT